VRLPLISLRLPEKPPERYSMRRQPLRCSKTNNNHYNRARRREKMTKFTYSNAGFSMTKSFEGLRTEAYQDAAGIWTIGYGHTGPDVQPGLKISEFEADALLRADMAAAVACVNRAVEVEITQPQFDALVDFCFNAGRGSFRNSSLLRYVNAEDFFSATVQFGLWIHAGGEVQPGLVRRRRAEADMFRAGSPSAQPDLKLS
jgi:lysozyme